ncbi:MFS transporter [Sphingopyxis indica]|uniref:Uncharacterized protein n=1 Tax=Sphingopyxis indica TaxID=436663 RepID=A0A239JYA6_9SPHN|nr:MFS transporter [Sphingopyxis indica]SNT10639.1 hypothetical protein SAMN06295955_111137 [Sphingopyxis indica]
MAVVVASATFILSIGRGIRASAPSCRRSSVTSASRHRLWDSGWRFKVPFGVSASATALGIIGFGNAVRSLIANDLGTHFSQKRLLALAFLLQSITIVCFVALPVTAESTITVTATMDALWRGCSAGERPHHQAVRFQAFEHAIGFVFLGYQQGVLIGSWIGGSILLEPYSNLLIVGCARHDGQQSDNIH